MRAFIILLETILVIVVLPLTMLSVWEWYGNRLIADGDIALADSPEEAYKKYARACDFLSDRRSMAVQRLNVCQTYGIGTNGVEYVKHVDCSTLIDKCFENLLRDRVALRSLSKMPKQDLIVESNLWCAVKAGDDFGNSKEKMIMRLIPLAESGNLWAQLELGDAYYDGKFVAKEPAEAFKWYLMAAENGDVRAQGVVANAYGNGHGVQRNYAEMAKWLKKAVSGGDANAEFMLGECYEKGRGVEKDSHLAESWYERAVDHKSPKACAVLAKRWWESGSKEIGQIVPLLQVAAEDGDAYAATQLGVCYMEGTGVVKNVDKAFQLFSKAVKCGDHPEALYRLAVCYCDGEGTLVDAKRGIRYLEQAANKNHAVAQRTLGYCYENGLNVEKNEFASFDWYKKAAENGDAIAQANVGVCYAQGEPVAKDEIEAVKWLRKAADEKIPLGEGFLGLFYLAGKGGLPKDPAKAASLLQHPAEGGDALCQYMLAGLYMEGLGVAKDQEKAFRLYLKSANGGNVSAQNKVGECYYLGHGIAVDYYKAFGWLKKAAEADDAYAQSSLALCYITGNGVQRDVNAAYPWAKKSADQGNALGQYMLGVCHENGYGYSVISSKSAALKWYQKSAAQGFDQAKKKVRELQRNTIY